MADLHATPKESVVGYFSALREYDPLLPLQSYPGPQRSVITPANDAPFGLHNLGADLPYVILEGTGHWLHMDNPEAFNRILDDFTRQVEKQA